MLEYKGTWYGRILVIGKSFLYWTLCSCCATVIEGLKLKFSKYRRDDLQRSPRFIERECQLNGFIKDYKINLGKKVDNFASFSYTKKVLKTWPVGQAV